MVAVEAASATEGPIRTEADAAAAQQLEAKVVPKAEEEREYKSDMRKLEDLMSKLNPSAEEFVPLSRRTASASPPARAALSADAPVFVSNAEFFGPAGVNLPTGGGGGGSRDSSSDGSSNGGGHPFNRRVAKE